MKPKKIITIFIAAAMICTAAAGCTKGENNGNAEQAVGTTAQSQEQGGTASDDTAETQIVTEVVSEVVTDRDGTAVTDKNGETQVVTKTVTKAVTVARSNENSTSKSTAAGTKNGAPGSGSTQSSAASSSAGNGQSSKKQDESSSTAKKNTTAKSNATTKKSTTTTTKPKTTTTTKPSTTQAQKEISIKLKKNGDAQCSSSNVTISPATVSNPQGTVYIEKGGDYIITSETDVWHGQIVIKLANTEEASVRIENVTITTTKANAIKILDSSIKTDRDFIEADASSGTSSGDTDNALQDAMKQVSKQEKAPNVSLSFPTGTTSSFTSNSNSISGVLYNESKLTVKGNGAVSFNSTVNRNNAIGSTKSVTFKNVTATLTTEANTSTKSLSSARGIFSYSKVNVESGKLIIKSNGDGIRCEEFNSIGGTTDITSSASDGIDADDAVNITGGSVSVTALEKSCLKVRRVNNQEKIDAGDKTVKADDGVKKAEHTFKIDGGTVVAMGKNITTVQKASKQASITCRSVKSQKGSDEAKKAIKFTIKGSGVNVSSPSSCIKYLYSSSGIDTSKSYTVSSSGYTSVTASFAGTVGDARIVAVK